MGKCNNEKFRSFKEQRKHSLERSWAYRGFGYYSLISEPIKMAKGARRKYCIFENLNMAVASMTDISRKIPKYSKFNLFRCKFTFDILVT